MNGTSRRSPGVQLHPSFIAYPNVHIEVTVPLQVQPNAELLSQDGTILQLNHETHFERIVDAPLPLSPVAKRIDEPALASVRPHERERERFLATVPSGTELSNSSSASCSSTPSAPHRACSPTQSLPASTTGSSSSGVPHSSVSTARRSRQKGLFESRRGSSASLTISLTPTSSTALGSISSSNCPAETSALPAPAASLPPADSRLIGVLPSSLSTSERTMLENIVVAKTRQPLTLASLSARVQQNPASIHEEFWSLPMNHFQKVTVPGASIKNRYRTILPNEHSRVTLQPPFHHRTGSLSSPSPTCTSQNVAALQQDSNEPPTIDFAISTDPLCIYINANYVRAYVPSVDRANRAAQAVASRAFIATQGPLPNTVVDFWRMCWFERTPCVVMITRLVEKGKAKCEAYLPPFNGIPNGGAGAGATSPSSATSPITALSIPSPSNVTPTTIVTQSFGDVQVAVLSLQIKDGYEVREVLLRCDNETHAVKHYWFTAWPDNKTPSTAKQLIQMILEIRAHRDKQAAILQRIRERHGSPSCSLRASTSDAYGPTAGSPGQLPSGYGLPLSAGCEQQPILLGPTIVHCSAGLGRTGCFIAICNAMQQFEAEQAADILGIVAQMRLDRGGLIQTNEQYEFVYRAICEYAMSYARSQTGFQF